MQEIDINSSYYKSNKEKEDSWTKLMRSLSKQFIYALCFKLLYKLTRNIDKLGIDNIDKDVLKKVLFSSGNLQFPFFIVLIRIFYKIFIYFLKFKFDINISDSKHRYLLRFISLLYGKFVSFLILLIGQKSNVIFYTVLVLILKSMYFFISSYYDREIINNNKIMNKHMYYMGVGLGFLNLTLALKSMREKIKLISFIGVRINSFLNNFKLDDE